MIKDYQRQVFKMSLLRVRIDQQRAEIGINSSPARMRIRKPQGQMSIRNEPTRLQIDTKAPSFNVNQQKIRNESGLKAPLDLAKDFRNTGKQAALRGARQNKDDGNFIANPNIPGDKSIPQLAKTKAMAEFRNRDINIGLMPASPAEIQWEKGQINMNWSKHSLVVDYNSEFMPEVTLDPMYSVEVFLRTQPYFRVSVEEMTPSGSPGRYIDQTV